MDRAWDQPWAWQAGLDERRGMRSDALSRASTLIVGHGRGLVKIYSIATWGDVEVAVDIVAT